MASDAQLAALARGRAVLAARRRLAGAGRILAPDVAARLFADAGTPLADAIRDIVADVPGRINRGNLAAATARVAGMSQRATRVIRSIAMSDTDRTRTPHTCNTVRPRT